MKHYRGIQAKFIPPTNNKGARVKLTDKRNSKSVYIDPLTDTINTTLETAEIWLKDKGFNVVGYADMSKTYIILVDNWGDNFIELKK